jgi:probable addiction module antidote protein
MTDGAEQIKNDKSRHSSWMPCRCSLNWPFDERDAALRAKIKAIQAERQAEFEAIKRQAKAREAEAHRGGDDAISGEPLSVCRRSATSLTMKTKFEPFDVSDHRHSDERIVGYLSAAAQDEDPRVLLLALSHAAKARGMMEIAKAAGLSRVSLYRALRKGAHPRFETVQAVVRALGLRLSVRRARPRRKRRRVSGAPHRA